MQTIIPQAKPQQTKQKIFHSEKQQLQKEQIIEQI